MIREYFERRKKEVEMQRAADSKAEREALAAKVVKLEKAAIERTEKGDDLLKIMNLVQKQHAAKEPRKTMLTARILDASDKFFSKWNEDALILMQKAFS